MAAFASPWLTSTFIFLVLLWKNLPHYLSFFFFSFSNKAKKSLFYLIIVLDVLVSTNL
jgi:hypothetical protein